MLLYIYSLIIESNDDRCAYNKIYGKNMFHYINILNIFSFIIINFLIDMYNILINQSSISPRLDLYPVMKLDLKKD